MASDGVWDVLSSTAVADFVWHTFGKGGKEFIFFVFFDKLFFIPCPIVTAQEVSEALIDRALTLGSSDNVAAVVIDLKNDQSKGIGKAKL